jgi:hypothetical protein
MARRMWRCRYSSGLVSRKYSRKGRALGSPILPSTITPPRRISPARPGTGSSGTEASAFLNCFNQNRDSGRSDSNQSVHFCIKAFRRRD